MSELVPFSEILGQLIVCDEVNSPDIHPQMIALHLLNKFSLYELAGIHTHTHNAHDHTSVVMGIFPDKNVRAKSRFAPRMYQTSMSHVWVTSSHQLYAHNITSSKSD